MAVRCSGWGTNNQQPTTLPSCNYSATGLLNIRKCCILGGNRAHALACHCPVPPTGCWLQPPVGPAFSPLRLPEGKRRASCFHQKKLQGTFAEMIFVLSLHSHREKPMLLSQKSLDPWCNGSTPDFGSVSLGSSPSGSTKNSNPCKSTNCKDFVF